LPGIQKNLFETYCRTGYPPPDRAQIVGHSGAAMRIDMLATAITVGATVDQLMNMDLAYSSAL
jgi:hypothetical protein